MERNVLIIIEKQYEYIRNTVFSDQNAFARNLKVIKFNPNLEWFNCSIIAGRETSSNRAIVNTIEGWETLLEIEGEKGLELTVHNIDPVKLLNPVYDYESNTLSFVTVDTYFIDDFKLPKNFQSYMRISAIENYIKKKKEYDDILKVLKEGWQNIFLHCYLEMFDFYFRASDELKEYYFAILCIAFGEELRIEEPPRIDALKDKLVDGTDLIFVYRNIHEMISCFHIAYISYINNVEMIYREIGAIAIDKNIVENSVSEVLKRLEHGETVRGVDICF